MGVLIASQIIKPSSPTPVGFKHHKLSYIDQISPPFYIPFIFFYEYDKSKDQEEISRRLKQSLSEILTIFYPLAGKIKQNSFVDCDDTGAEFVEARVHARLAELIQNPKIEELRHLVPVDSASHNDNVILTVKISYFDCGGISVGICLSHKISDGSSCVMFMNAWSAMCRGESSRIIHPSFDAALHFPPSPREHPLASGFDVGIKKEKMVTKRLVLESKKIEKLRKEAAAASASVKNPTRVEAVSAFIWRSFIEAAGKETSSPLSSFASHAVNLRPRTVPPLPDHSFGNYGVTASPAVSSSSEDDHVSKLRAAIRAVDGDYINNVVKDGNYLETLDMEALFNPRAWIFSSWWRFPVYDVDFGWGKPVWVGTTTTPFKNSIILMSTPSGDGMEAWVNYDPEEDDFFQLLQHNYNNLI